MKLRIICILFLNIFINSFAQNNDHEYLSLLNEINVIVNDNFISPFKTNDVFIINDNYSGFGYKMNPFTGKFSYSILSVINCNVDENIYSMTDGIVKEIGYEEIGPIIIIEFKDIEIHYLLVRHIEIKEGDIIKKGQLIGKISSPYYHYGPALFLRLKYKEKWFDPILLLHEIIR
jgi:murein DD-endopeptidase MepM/ murein hydrolase activator NlpD